MGKHQERWSNEEHDAISHLGFFFWQKLRTLLKLTKPIWNTIGFKDSDISVVGEAYDKMDTMLGLIKESLIDDPAMFQFVHILVQYWISCTLHCIDLLMPAC